MRNHKLHKTPCGRFHTKKNPRIQGEEDEEQAFPINIKWKNYVFFVTEIIQQRNFL